MKWAAFWLACVATVAPTVIVFSMAGCARNTDRHQAVKTVWSTARSVDSSYRKYLDGVMAGKVRTNSVAGIADRYIEFRSLFSQAITQAALSTNAPPAPELLNSASQLRLIIDAEKIR